MTSDAPIRQLSAPDLKALLESGTAIELVDVRTHEERAIAAIEGSRLLDQTYHDALLLRDRDTPLVFQCHHGVRSQHAAILGSRASAPHNLRAVSTPGRSGWVRAAPPSGRRRQTPRYDIPPPHRLRHAVIDIPRARSSLDA
jgi:rhodanese-related sulfurtransferase